MFAPSKWSYRRVSTERSEGMKEVELETGQKHRPFLSGSRNIFILAIITICGTTILMVLGLYQVTSPSPGKASSSHPINTCGNSTAEALSLGCTFDQLMWAWYPKQCPHYANDQYVNAEPEPWKFYIDPYKKVVATDTDWAKMLDNEVQLYGERREHLTHCVFMYLGVGQIIRDGGRYTPLQVEYKHLDHCSKILLKALRKDEAWFEIETGTPPVRYDQAC